MLGKRVLALMFAVNVSAMFAASSPFEGARFVGRTTQDAPFYGSGEAIVFTVALVGMRGEIPSGCRIRWVRTGDDGRKESGLAPLTRQPFRYTTSLNRPGFVRLRAVAVDAAGCEIETADRGGWEDRHLFFDGSAGVEPAKLQALPEPKDFDAFWERQRKRLVAVPIKAELDELVSKNPDVAIYALSVAAPGGRPATGYLSMPRNDVGKYPVLLTLHGYGKNVQEAPQVRSADVIHLDLNAHGYELGREMSYYKDFFRKVETGGCDYAFDPVQNSKPETAYFNGMVMRVLRALEYLKSRPEWNGRDVWVEGSSQGGLQTAWAAALDPDVTLARSTVTWCCDLGGETLGRNRGEWFLHYTPALAYYDPVNMAKRVPKTCAFEIPRAGLGDYTCPPSGLAILYNNLSCPKKITWVQGSGHGWIPAAPRQEFTFSSKWSETSSPISGSADDGDALPMDGAAFFGGGFKRDENGEIVCDNGEDALRQAGAAWSVELNQSEPCPVVFTAESRMEQGASGPRNDNYSIYADIACADGTHVWGRVAMFERDSGLGWQTRRLRIDLPKPIKSIRINLLFRNMAGRVRFRIPRWKMIPVRDPVLWDGHVQQRPSVKVNAAGFFVRDVANNGAFTQVVSGMADGLRIRCERTTNLGVRSFQVSVESLRRGDRAVTLAFAIPIKGAAVSWCGAPGALQMITDDEERVEGGFCAVGAGPLSRWPFGAVVSDGHGIAIGMDPGRIAFHRFVYNHDLRVLFLACDLGFSEERRNAEFGFSVFPFSGENGFRGALEKYMAIYHQFFLVRVRRQGNWMAFAPISKVKGWRDFGFAFKEGDGETDWDDVQGVHTFRYVEPATWWMKMPKTGLSEEEEARRQMESGLPAALAWGSSVFRDAEGKAVFRPADTPWCKGCVWSMNTAPGLRGSRTDWSIKYGDPEFSSRYTGVAPHGLDGEYVDSSELYATAESDFDHRHFSCMDTPLTYDRETYRPCIYKGMVAYECIRKIAECMHPTGRFVMANSTPDTWWFLVPWLDVCGTETTWLTKDGKYSPMSDENLFYRRAMSGAKPFCFLQNCDYSRFSRDMMDRYMRHSLAYGIFPSCFSADAATAGYFERPQTYERDRGLFRKYLPLIRKIAEAGWRPVNRVLTVRGTSLILEQFGDEKGNVSYSTVRNPSSSWVEAQLSSPLVGPGPVDVREMVSDEMWRFVNGICRRHIPADFVGCLEFVKR